MTVSAAFYTCTAPTMTLVMMGEEAQVWLFRGSFLLILQRVQDAKCYLRRAKPCAEAADAVQHCSFCCASTDHGRASSWDRKCSVYTQTLAFFLRVPIIMVFFVIWAHIHYELACTHQLILYRPWNIHQMAAIPIRVQR